MATEKNEVELSMDDLRAVTGFAAASAQDVLEIFEEAQPDDPRPREAIDAAWAFARGGKRNQALRVTAMAAHRAARDADPPAAAQAATAAGHAAAAAYLHPLANATQVKHILGAAAHAAMAVELLADGDPRVGARRIEQACRRAAHTVVDVLARYPEAPPGGGRAGELLRELDRVLRTGS